MNRTADAAERLTNGHSYDAVVSDLNLPDTTGEGGTGAFEDYLGRVHPDDQGRVELPAAVPPEGDHKRS